MQTGLSGQITDQYGEIVINQRYSLYEVKYTKLNAGNQMEEYENTNKDQIENKNLQI